MVNDAGSPVERGTGADEQGAIGTSAKCMPAGEFVQTATGKSRFAGGVDMSVYEFEAERIDGKVQSLRDYEGRVLLIVNTASKCGFTPQLEGLEQLYRKYRDRGFVVLGFPCNQFGGQDPGTNSEIAQFCRVNYGVSFPMFAKIDVNGKHAHPLYRYLRKQAGFPMMRFIKWNFTKFLINREGRVVKRFSPATPPDKLEPHIQALL